MRRPARIELRIGQLVVDGDALGSVTPEALRQQVQAAVAQRLGGSAGPAPAAAGAPLAGQIGSAVADRLEPHVPVQG